MNPLVNRTVKVFKFGIFALQAAAVLIALYETYKKSQHDEELPQHSDSDLRSKFASGKRDIIDESSWESFPASDAPASNKFT